MRLTVLIGMAAVLCLLAGCPSMQVAEQAATLTPRQQFIVACDLATASNDLVAQGLAEKRFDSRARQRIDDALDITSRYCRERPCDPPVPGHPECMQAPPTPEQTTIDLLREAAQKLHEAAMEANASASTVNVH